jgi:hypothetical protein
MRRGKDLGVVRWGVCEWAGVFDNELSVGNGTGT